MSTSLRADLTRRLCLDAAFLTTAMTLSYLESLIPFGLILPLPGFKLGLANLAVTLAFVLIGWRDAAIISSLRILLMNVLFGSASSFFFSALGGLFAFAALILASLLLKKCSYVGISALCAAAHNLGQLLAAVCLFGSGILLSYLPVLLIAALLSGSLSGIVLNLSIPTLKRSFHL